MTAIPSAVPRFGFPADAHIFVLLASSLAFRSIWAAALTNLSSLNIQIGYANFRSTVDCFQKIDSQKDSSSTFPPSTIQVRLHSISRLTF